ncbi:MAG: CBS domain-containing protein [Verrucomicrobiota bacterium]
MQARKVSEIMTRAVVAAKPDMRLTDAIKVMLEHNVSAVPVMDAQQNLIGIITEYDIMNFAFSGNAAETTVAEVMIRDVVTFTPDTDIETLVNFCAQRRMHRVPIVEDKKVVGMVSRRDILREIARLYGEY